MASPLCSSFCSVRVDRVSGLPIRHSQPHRQMLRIKRQIVWRRNSAKVPARAVQTPQRPASAKIAPTVPTGVDIDSRYNLRGEDIQSYRDNAFVKLRNVFDKPTLDHYASSLSLEVKEADKTPLQKDPDYQQAFTQVLIGQQLSKLY